MTPPDHSPAVRAQRRRAGHALAAAWLVLALCWAGATHAFDARRMLAAAERQGPLAVQGVTALQAVLLAFRDEDDAARLVRLNDFFNRRVLFRDDASVWGQADYWASPVEMLGRGAGDCEDFAIAKYFSLVAAGTPRNRLRLVYVRATLGGPGGVAVPHMVLAYYASPGSEPLILDNLISEIRPASRRPDLAPVFSFNADGLWEGIDGSSAGDPSQRLSRWRAVLAKVREEGLP